MQNLSQISEGWIHSKTHLSQNEMYLTDFPLITKNNALCYKSAMEVDGGKLNLYFLYFSWVIKSGSLIEANPVQQPHASMSSH